MPICSIGKESDNESIAAGKCKQGRRFDSLFLDEEEVDIMWREGREKWCARGLCQDGAVAVTISSDSSCICMGVTDASFMIQTELL
jgi:hypothetical protein